jgi:hypothetical protein
MSGLATAQRRCALSARTSSLCKSQTPFFAPPELRMARPAAILGFAVSSILPAVALAKAGARRATEERLEFFCIVIRHSAFVISTIRVIRGKMDRNKSV